MKHVIIIRTLIRCTVTRQVSDTSLDLLLSVSKLKWTCHCSLLIVLGCRGIKPPLTSRVHSSSLLNKARHTASYQEKQGFNEKSQCFYVTVSTNKMIINHWSVSVLWGDKEWTSSLQPCCTPGSSVWCGTACSSGTHNDPFSPDKLGPDE